MLSNCALPHFIQRGVFANHKEISFSCSVEDSFKSQIEEAEISSFSLNYGVT